MPRGLVRCLHRPGCPARGERRRCRCDGAWPIRFYDGLIWRFERGGFETKDDAERALAQAVRAIDHGSFAEVTRRLDSAGSAARWIETYPRPNTKPSTCRDYEGSIRNHLVPCFGDIELRRITRRDGAALHGRLSRRAGRPTARPRGPRRRSTGRWCPCVRYSAMRSSGATWTRARPRRSGAAPEAAGAGDPGAAELAAVLDIAEVSTTLIFRMAALSSACAAASCSACSGATWNSSAGACTWPDLHQYSSAAPPRRPAEPARPGVRLVGWHLDRPGQPDHRLHCTLRRAGVRLLAFHRLRHTAVSPTIASEGLNSKQLQSVIGTRQSSSLDTYGHLMPDSFEGFGSGLDAVLDPAPEAAFRRSRGHGGVIGEDLATPA